MVRLTDLELIKALKENSDISHVELAKRFGVTEAAVRKRIKRLKHEGIIKKFTIEVDIRKLGFEVHTLVGLDVSPEKLIHVLEDLKCMNEVISLYTSSGDHMILIECWFKNMEELSSFVKKLSSIDGVVKVCPAIILERIK